MYAPDPAALLNEFAARVDGGEPVTAAFVAPAVDSGCGRYDGLVHLAERVGSGREEVWEWFDGVVGPAAVDAIRVGAHAGDITGGLRRAIVDL